MTQNVNPTFVKTPNNGQIQISSGTGSSGLVTVYTGGANGSKVVMLLATATTTQAQDVQWGITVNASTFYLMGTISVPAAAGSSDSIPSVNLFNGSAVPGLPVDSDGNVYVLLSSSANTLQAKSPTLVASGAINLTVTSGDF